MLTDITFPESFDATIFQFEPPVGVDLIEVGGS
jgi:outer membrane lipoprotein-sorting protein